jgi:uncharacterized membrane protein
VQAAWYQRTHFPQNSPTTHLLALAQNFSVHAKHFYAFYLLSHGVAKLLLVVGLSHKDNRTRRLIGGLTR